MATLNFKNINKIYDNNVQAVFDFNLDIKDNEFIIFVGPSGCGKSTTLRMVAGLEAITSGELYIDGRLVNYVEPKDRGIAMVFQNYALYPTMTVYKNMSFSLRIRKFPEPILDEDGNTIKVVDTNSIKLIKEEIKDAKYIAAHNPESRDEYLQKVADLETKIKELEENPSADKVKMVHLKKEVINERVMKAAEILGLTEYLKRKPSALSGGQCQRVALGRAIVRSPKVFLMDEPLSNLDAKLRVQMRTELTRIHNEVGATTIYVTHDQTEAMTMADRIVVMKAGYIQQIATPKEVYEHPNNMFVATFIGSPSMNILEAKYNGNTLEVGDALKVNVAAAFKPIYKEFYEKILNNADENIIELRAELEQLQLRAKANAKAIKQREDALKAAIKNKENAELSIQGDAELVNFGIRPEDIYMVGDGNNSMPSKPISIDVDQVELLGQELIVYSSINGTKIIFKVPSKHNINAGDKIKVCIDLSKIHLFDYASTLRLPFDSSFIKN